MTVGHGPFSRRLVERIVEEASAEWPKLEVQLEEDVSVELFEKVAAGELAAAVVQEMPGAARRYRVRVEALRDEPLLAALPVSHEYAGADAIPIGVFARERVLLPREPTGRVFNSWLRAVIRAAGFELEQTLETLSAPWDRQMLRVADGETVSVFVSEWAEEAAGVAAVPFDPPLTFPIDFASARSPSDGVKALVEAARRVRDAEGWLTQRPARVELPGD